MEEKASILIVDDNINLCKTMSFTLRHKGYEVTTASSGLEAIEMVKERPFHVIFIDIKMPLMGGVETYKRIKEIRPDTVVMMMTAYAVEELVQEALHKGAYGIVYKPVDIEKAVEVIEESMGRGQGALVLVVDDDPGTCTTLKRVLTKRGYKVSIAYRGEEAIALAREAAHDIFLIDVKLPTINGLETYLKIREINREAVVIMMTAYRQEVADLMEEAMCGYAYTCLYKPFDMEKLLSLLKEALKRKQKAG